MVKWPSSKGDTKHEKQNLVTHSRLGLLSSIHVAGGDETLAAIQSGKQKRINLCRARYRDCLSRNQIPSFECRYIYHDCINHIV